MLTYRRLDLHSRHRFQTKERTGFQLAPESHALVVGHRLVALGFLCIWMIVLGSVAGCQIVISRMPRAATATQPPISTGYTKGQVPRPIRVPPTPLPTATAIAMPLPTATVAEPPPSHSPPTRIAAPSIGLDAPVVPIGWHQEKRNGQTVSVWDVSSNAAGWHKNSAYAGQMGNVVLSGHHNIEGEVFRHVVDLKPGDRITLYTGDVPYIYVVSLRLIVPEKGVSQSQQRQNARWIGATRDARLTLVTCWPYTNNTHRVIVVAKLLDRGQVARRG